jgi:gliding motility-associated-like protein
MNIEGNYYGWDGIYNGNVLDASDYWFTAVLTDIENNTFNKSGHFTLKH